MLHFDLLAEQRIQEAIERGEFEDLPGHGRPLDLDDDPLIPDELRVAYRILKNAGCVPPELECLREIGELERLIAASAEGENRRRALTRLNLLLARIDARPGSGPVDLRSYRGLLLARLDRGQA